MTVAFDNLTLSQRVYEHLREEILADHLLPGTELSEVALSKELAISRGRIVISPSADRRPMASLMGPRLIASSLDSATSDSSVPGRR